MNEIKLERNILKKLVKWKESDDRKPLVLMGSRQVGKTWLLKEFGRIYYKNYVYLNFDEEDELNSIFKNNKKPDIILEKLSYITGTKIEEGKTLIIFDEIQECPEALNSLKYFNEEKKDYHICSAGSLLGTYLGGGHSYPVGQVDILDISPLTFEEFLNSVDKNMYSYYKSIKRGDTIDEIFHTKLLDLYHSYLIIGGMPEVVSSFVKNRDPEIVLKKQSEILRIYENDFQKYSDRISSDRLLLIYRSIVGELSKENEKFIFGAMKNGARAREYESSIEYLVSSGIVKRIYNVSKAEMPLSYFKRLDHFKLFFFDTGLIKRMANVDSSALILGTHFQFRGPLIENYVLEELNEDYKDLLYYYSNKNKEIDFLLQYSDKVIPIECKSSKDTGSVSFKNFIKENNSPFGIRYSELNYKENGKIINIPLYLVGKTKELLPSL